MHFAANSHESPALDKQYCWKRSSICFCCFCGCTVNGNWLSAYFCAAWVVLFYRNAFSVSLGYPSACQYQKHLFCVTHISPYLFTRKKMYVVLCFPLDLAFWERCIFFCDFFFFFFLNERESKHCCFWSGEIRLFGTHPWENSVCARNYIYFSRKPFHCA